MFDIPFLEGVSIALGLTKLVRGNFRFENSLESHAHVYRFPQYDTTIQPGINDMRTCGQTLQIKHFDPSNKTSEYGGHVWVKAQGRIAPKRRQTHTTTAINPTTLMYISVFVFPFTTLLYGHAVY